MEQSPAVRILQLVPESLPTFRADVATLFGKYLPRHGVQCDLVGKGGKEPLAESGFASQRRAATGSRWKRELSFVRLALRSLLGAKRENCDVIQVRDMVSIGLMALLIARLKGLRVVYWVSFLMSEGRILTARADLARRFSLRACMVLAKGAIERQVLYSIVLRHVDHVFVQSDAMAELMVQRGIPMERMTPVPMGVDMEKVASLGTVQRHWPGLEGKPVVAYLGTLDPARCLERVCDALVLVRKEIPDAQLLLIGNSPRPADAVALLDYAASIGLRDVVHTTGWLPMSEAWEYLASATVAVSYIPRGNLYDVSSPTKLLEYLALGMPSVGNDTPDQARVLSASGAGWLCASNPAAMAESLLDVLRDPAAARARAAQGPAFIEAHRSYRALAVHVAASYRALLGQRNGVPAASALPPR